VIFEWDEAKRTGNLAKHGVDFEDVRAFDLVAAIRSLDVRRDYGETRWRATGSIGGRLHVLVFTWRGESISVISLRNANHLKVAAYETETHS